MRSRAIGFVLVVGLFSLGCEGPRQLDFTGAPTLPVGEASPRRFDVTGTAELEVEDFRLTGTFEAVLVESTPGSVALTHLETDLEDQVIVKRSWFSTLRIRLRCTRAQATHPVAGTVNSAGGLEFPAGGLEIWGISYEARNQASGCPGTGDTIRIEGSNQSVFQVVHDPAADLFQGEGSFAVEVAGETRTARLEIDGHYRNRPPDALIASVAADAFDLPQGGCPPLQPGSPPYVVANRAAGLAVTFSSRGSDPDGSFGTADVALEQWAVYRGGPGNPAAPYLFLGRGRGLETLLFPAGHEYTLSLFTTDHHGSVDEDRCTFFVAPKQ